MHLKFIYERIFWSFDIGLVFLVAEIDCLLLFSQFPLLFAFFTSTKMTLLTRLLLESKLKDQQKQYASELERITCGALLMSSGMPSSSISLFYDYFLPIFFAFSITVFGFRTIAILKRTNIGLQTYTMQFSLQALVVEKI